jgi:Xaa-Pro dipeptidase
MVDAEIIEKQRRALAAAGLDALVSLSPENVTYTSGVVVPSQPLMRWRHAACVVTADGAVAMVVVDMEETTVKAHGGLSDVRVYREFADDPMESLAALLLDRGLGRARIGIETDFIPAKDYETLKRRLPGAELVAAEAIFQRLRQVKTAGELDRLRRLSRLTDRAIGEALSSAHEGMSEMELAGRLTAALFGGGAESFKLMIIASGERSQFPNVGPSERRLERGDLIRMEIFGVLGGYHAGVCRTAVVGEPTAEQERIWAHLVACKYLVLERIRPGASAPAIYRAFLDKFTELGFAPISFVGHGIGLHLHEEPYLGRYGESTLEAGMVLAIEPLVYIPGRMGLQNKDMVAVTEEGCELLSNQTATDELIRVG